MGYLKAGWTISQVAKELGRDKSAISRLAKKAREMGEEKAMVRSPGCGRKNLASLGDIRKILRMVQKRPFITAKSIKRLLGEDGDKFSVRRIREILQNAGYKSRHAARKPLLTERMKMQRMEFATSHLHWTAEMWGKVMFTDESTFRLVRGGIKRVRRPPGSNRFDQKFCVKTVKHSGSIMVWAGFDGRWGRAGISFLKPGTTMNAEVYVATLEDHLLEFFHGRGCTHLLQDSAPCHKARRTMAFLEDQGIEVIKWPGNSPDLNPIENLWTVFKNKLEEKKCTSVAEMKEEITRIWCRDITKEYCRTLAQSMPRRLQAVLEADGGHTKY